MSTSLKTLKIFVSYWMQYPWLALGSFIMGPALALQTIIAPLFVAKILGQLASNQTVNFSNVWFAALSLFGGALLWFVSDKYFSVNLDLNIVRHIHMKNFNHLLSQDYSFFTNTFGGSLVAQANRFERAYELFHATVFLEMSGQLISVLFALGIMVYYSPFVGSITGIFWIASVIFVCYLGVKRMPLRRKAVATDTIRTGELADVVTNAITVKTFATETSEFSRYSKATDKFTNRLKLSWDVAIRNNITIQILCGILQLIVLIGGIYAVQSGRMSVAIFLLFEIYVLRMIDSIGKASLFVRQFEGFLGDAHEMTELLERTPRLLDTTHPQVFNITRGEISFNNIGFKYDEQHVQELLFDKLSFNVHPGEHVGLVGPSGGGKTTITRLLLRFHDLLSGTINIDGQNIASITQADLHNSIAYVPQEPLLFHRSLGENIAYGKPVSTKDEIIEVAKRAHAHDFISILPQGYETLVGERGVKLSGGQRQRIAIARAMLKDAPILLLDEATSALDSESEKLIQDALWKLMKGKTALVIAHRLSTIQRMDRIIVLDDGKIIEEGKHSELLKLGGLYAKLWKHQSGGFLEE